MIMLYYLNRCRTGKKITTGLCVPFVDISLRASFYSASHFSTEIWAREFARLLKRHTVLYRLSQNLIHLMVLKSLIKLLKSRIYSMQKKSNSFVESLWFLCLPKFGAAHQIQTLTKIQREISLKIQEEMSQEMESDEP